MTSPRSTIPAGARFAVLAAAVVLAPAACANGPSPSLTPSSDAGRDASKDATLGDVGVCGVIGHACCAPPIPCATGAFCAPDGTCKTSHPSDIGVPCSSPSDCSSGICGYTQGIADGAAPVADGNGTPPPQTTGCTVGCYQASDCPPGWSCEQLSVGEGLCTCTYAEEICDGLDNNCDGIVDNEPEVDNACTLANMGIPQRCVHGACQCVNECDGNCVDISNDDNNCGKCGNVCTAMVEKCIEGACACAYVMCGTACVNTKSTDNANCGDCGVPCDYQCAEGSCGPGTFVTGLTNPGSIAVDATNVYWIDEGTKVAEVEYCPLAGCTGGKPTLLAVASATSKYTGGNGELAVLAKSVYFADDGGDVELTPITGGSGTASVYAKTGSGATFLAATNTSLAWANEADKSVFACAIGKTCASPTTVAVLDGKKPEGFAVSGSTAYFGVFDTKEYRVTGIDSAPIAGGGPVTTLCTLGGFIDSISQILVVGTNLYVASDGGNINVCALGSAGAKAEVFAKSAATALATDGTDLYWSETKSKSGGAISKCALGANCGGATTVAPGVKSASSLAVGATNVFWTTSDGVGYFHK